MKTALLVNCPRCKKIVDWHITQTRPFCSNRCRDGDWNSWLAEEYKVVGDPLESTKEPIQ